MSYLCIIILVGFLINACLNELNLGVTEVLFVEFNKMFLFFYWYYWYCPTLSFRSSIVSPLYLVLRRGLIIVSRWFGVAIFSLVVATSMCPAIIVKICRHWLIRLYLEMCFGGDMRSAGINPADFLTVGGEDSHKLLFLGKNLLQNFYGSYCNGRW